MLTKEQEQATQIIMQHIDDVMSKKKSDKFVTLEGAAGCGKTYTITNLVKSLQKHYTIGFAAPTHKAVKVIRGMLQRNNIVRDGIRCGTIHSFLGLTMKRIRGDEVLVKDKFSEEKVFNILIIDECSMINDELLMYIMACESSVVIFVGDRYQISPIESKLKNVSGFEGNPVDGISRTFNEVDTTAKLTEINRTAKENGIIQYATQLRMSQDIIESNIPMPSSNINNGMGVALLTRDVFYKSAMNQFKSQDFKDNYDHVRMIAYTNECVNVLNQMVRKELYGLDAQEYIEDEILVMQSTDDNMRWFNADEVRVINVSEQVDDEYDIHYWLLRVENLNNLNAFDICVPKSEDQQRVKRQLEIFAEKAMNNKELESLYWRDYWTFKKRFADVKHVYAQTAHKSQGSTYKYTFVYMPDYLRFGSTLDVKRLLYTSTTRSSDMTLFTY